MRLSDLRGKYIQSLDGKSLGRVHEVHCDHGRVVALMCGPASLVERWTAKSRGRRVPWNEVVRMERGTVVVANAGADKRF
jgi:sporulation protein YlmC with PRC-barrel domain